MMKLKMMFGMLMLAPMIVAAHCGSCEKKTDGPACPKHKSELLAKDSTAKASPCDSANCPKKGDAAKCDKHKGDCTKEKCDKPKCDKTKK